MYHHRYRMYLDKYMQIKLAVWQTVIRHVDGCDLLMIVSETGQPIQIVREYLEDLYVEDKVFQGEDGRWYPEMGVS